MVSTSRISQKEYFAGRRSLPPPKWNKEHPLKEVGVSELIKVICGIFKKYIIQGCFENPSP